MSNNNNSSNYNATYIDNLIKFLPQPNISDSKDKQFNIGQSLWNISNKFFTGVNRIKNQKFEDGNWYDETKARELVIDYINKPECTKALNPHHKKIENAFSTPRVCERFQVPLFV
jgi:hypothetical protein